MSPETAPRRGRVLLLGVTALVVALVAGFVGYQVAAGEDDGGDAGAGADLRTQAPLGLDIYAPTEAEVTAGEHGSLIWSREITGGGVEGATTHLVIYRSVGAKGQPVAVSGLVTLPDGEPPEGGWPVLSWGHGTTGTADACAPSRGVLPGQANFYAGMMNQVVGTYVERGYAVVATDYEGLGTPGPHPYLLGGSAGRAMTDIVSAARDLDGRVSGRWLAAGHSQGGQAALWTAGVGDDYAPDLDLQGIVALAPPSQLPGAREDEDGLAGSIFLGPVVASAAEVADVDPGEVFTPTGEALLPQLEERCLDGLSEDDSFGGLAADELVQEDADLGPVEEVVAENDASTLEPSVPVLLVHGTGDTTVPVSLSDALEEQYEEAGTDLTYERVDGANHVDILLDAQRLVDEWAAQAAPELP